MANLLSMQLNILLEIYVRVVKKSGKNIWQKGASSRSVKNSAKHPYIIPSSKGPDF
jgi:hypothetical protein